ncbi:HAD family hydrolase [Luteimicrobium subarcticum]|uniref:Phosphoglycolate phosphatase n=1 Tax=Luteimicrobium subarcticum TaxID=620910 RepID=A0A2M8W6L2_9MICO|nr:HAD hydrolase-like protein [Luteimicrobium subarcticum]PJI86570.1 phosphoglycolate phosphatase [Luteimicrobium subarcticum]
MNAAELLADAKVVLLDFDGPVTLLMPPPMNGEVADALRDVLRQHGAATGFPETTDHLAVLRWTAQHARSALEDVERAADELEVEAALRAVPTRGSAELLAHCREQRKPVVVVSNNAAVAVRAYLERWELADAVAGIVGRPQGHPERMKPRPDMIHDALALRGAVPGEAVLIGDSVTDIEVAQATGVQSIGYAKTPRRGEELAVAGADALAATITNLLLASGE